MARKPYMLFLWSNRNKQPPFLRMQCGYECGGNCRNLLEIQSHSYILGTILQVDHVDPTTWRICLLSWGCGHLPGNMEKQKQSLLWQKKKSFFIPLKKWFIWHWHAPFCGIGQVCRRRRSKAALANGAEQLMQVGNRVSETQRRCMNRVILRRRLAVCVWNGSSLRL